MATKNEIKLEVQLDEEKIPKDIFWNASQDPNAPAQACKAFLLSVFDKETKETLKIDLWTKDMQVIEMDRFFYYSLAALADTYFRATGNAELAGEFRAFTQHFGKTTGILENSPDQQ
jgi:gliding motility-associated protein GldC